MTVQLFAEDEAGQTGESEQVDFVLPERIFTDPLARAIIEQRKWLALHSERYLSRRTTLGCSV